MRSELMRSRLMRFVMQGGRSQLAEGKEPDVADVQADAPEEVETKSEEQRPGSPHTPRTPPTFLKAPPEDLAKFLADNSITRIDLDHLNQLVQAGVGALRLGRRSHKADIPALTASLVELCLLECAGDDVLIELDATGGGAGELLTAPSLSHADYQVIQQILTTFTMISWVSGCPENEGYFSTYLPPTEWMLLYLHTQTEQWQSLTQHALNSDIYRAFNDEVLRRIHEIRGSDAPGTLSRCWLDNWYAQFVLKQSQQTTVQAPAGPSYVPLMMNQLDGITLMPFATDEDQEALLKTYKHAMHIGARLHLVFPRSDLEVFPEYFREKILGRGGRYATTVVRVFLPVPDLLNMPSSHDQLEKQQQWLQLLMPHTLWSEVVLNEPNASRLAVYKRHMFSPSVLRSGIALRLLDLFLQNSDASPSGFYAQLGNLLNDTNRQHIKHCWLYALVRAALGFQGVVMMLPRNDADQVFRDAYVVLQAVIDHLYANIADISIEACQQHVRQLGSVRQLREISAAPRLEGFVQAMMAYEPDLHYGLVYKKAYHQLNAGWLPQGVEEAAVSYPLERVAQELEQCALAAKSFLQVVADQQSTRHQFRQAYNHFLLSFIQYHYFHLSAIEMPADASSASGAGDQSLGDDLRVKIEAVFLWHRDHRRRGEALNINTIKDLAVLLELLKVLSDRRWLGQRSEHLHIFAQSLVNWIKPVRLDDPGIGRSQIWQSVRARYGYSLATYQNPDFAFMIDAYNPRLDYSSLERSIETMDQRYNPWLLLLLYASGHSPADVAVNNAHGKWLKVLSFYLPVVAVAQWAMLRLPVASAANQYSGRFLRGASRAITPIDVTTPPAWVVERLLYSDIAVGFVVVVALERLFENLGGCEKALRHPVMQAIFASAYIVLPISMEIIGHGLIYLDPDDDNGTTLLVFANSFLFVIAAGAPFKLANQVARLLSFVFPESVLRFVYEAALGLCRCHKEGRAKVVRLHTQQFANRFVYAATVTGAFSTGCFNFPSFAANLVGNLPGNNSAEWGEDISFGGVVGSIAVPSIVFYTLLFRSPQFRWFRYLREKCCCRSTAIAKTSLSFSDGAEAVFCLLVAIGDGLFFWKEAQFVSYQHQGDMAQIMSNSTFMFGKKWIEFGAVAIAVLCFMLWVVMHACKNASESPFLNSVQPPDDKLRCLNKLGKMGRRKRVGANQGLLAGYSGRGYHGAASRAAEDPPTERCNVLKRLGACCSRRRSEEGLPYTAASASADSAAEADPPTERCSWRDYMPSCIVSCFGL